MKQVRWLNANRSASVTTRRTGSRGRAVIAALLIVVAGMSGCKAKSKEVAVNPANQNISTQAVSLPATPGPATATTPQVSEPLKPKKVVKKRLETVLGVEVIWETP